VYVCVCTCGACACVCVHIYIYMRTFVHMKGQYAVARRGGGGRGARSEELASNTDRVKDSLHVENVY